MQVRNAKFSKTSLPACQYNTNGAHRRYLAFPRASFLRLEVFAPVVAVFLSLPCGVMWVSKGYFTTAVMLYPFLPFGQISSTLEIRALSF
jgi:hypothetical protein